MSNARDQYQRYCCPAPGWDLVQPWQKGLIVNLRSQKPFEGDDKYLQAYSYARNAQNCRFFLTKQSPFECVCSESIK